MKRYFFLLFSLFLMLLSCQEEKQYQFVSVALNDNWSFKAVKDSFWMPAQVPGSVHTDLMANEKIEDPYYRLNERDVQWVDKLDWEYKCNFQVDRKTLEMDQINLLFRGLDTYATVLLNDNLLFESDNMFIEQNVSCKDWLREGENELHILFKSPITVGLEKREQLGYILPGAENDQSERGGLNDIKTVVFSRKAQYHFGWDWGPRLVSSGIWKDIELKAWNTSRIEDMYVRQTYVDSDEAHLEIQLSGQNLEAGEYSVELMADSTVVTQVKDYFEAGEFEKNYNLRIANPRLWWPNALGEQNLYEIKAVLKKRDVIQHSYSERIGLRTIELVQKADDIGHSFAFKVNGHEIFMKGANYIPQDVFLARVSDQDYEKLIKDAVEANFNMIRIWGGGVYERDIFYDLCDQYGILVWQDFMFACAMYPGNDEFLQNVREEATFQVKRLRNHPSIALWCGDNEILSAWNKWGWKEDVLENQGQEIADRIWHAYDTLFHKILPSVVDKNDPSRHYWSSSPSAGIGKLQDWKSGDVHYWGVWWGKEPFENYSKNIGRFMSEYGFQSFPNINSVKKYTVKEDWDVFSEVMKSHQRSSIGNGTIIEYMDRDYKKPFGFEQFLYVNQVLQAEGIRTAIEAHRRNKPFCMGSLYWQLNDCWPVASWSGIDYYGDWKALHYYVKKAFEPLLLSLEVNEDQELEVFMVSDLLENKKGQLQMSMLDFEGNEYWSFNFDFEIIGNTSISVFKKDVNSLIQGLEKSNIVFQVKFLDDKQEVLAKNQLFFAKPAELNLIDPGIGLRVKNNNGVYDLTLKSPKLAKNVYLNLKGSEGHFTDNYFDMMPGEIKMISYQTEDSLTTGDFFRDLKIKTLINSDKDWRERKGG